MRTAGHRALRRPRRSGPRGVEVLEDRQLLSTFAVTNLRDAGAGSFRQAIIDANARPGADTIDFRVAGTIQVGPTSLPAVRDTLAIDGTSAPTYSGAPVVTLDFQGTQGLTIGLGADGSVVRSLALVRSGGAGLTLDASDVTVQGNTIGLLADGTTPAGNLGDGVRVNASSHGDLIGALNPVSGISYYNSDSVGMQPVSGWQGIRASNTAGQYLITGTSDTNGLLYVGPISGVGGTSYPVNYPGAATTSVYGPDIVAGNVLRLVGSMKTGNGEVQGFLFEGTTADLADAAHYRTIDYPGAKYTYVHSTMGGLAVGNADGPEGDAPIGTGHAFIYGVAAGQILTDVVYPGATSTTAYGIWHNGGTGYTICGGYTRLGAAGLTVASGYLVDYDSATGKFSHWTSISSPAATPNGQSLATHFEGISSPQAGVYTLAAGMTDLVSGGIFGAALTTVERNQDGSFGPTFWVDLKYPGASAITTANSVIGNQVVGIADTGAGFVSYQATVHLDGQVSNVIGGNGGNGVGIYGGADNRVAMNHIGTDVSGMLPRGNARNGILVTNGAAGNFIGGQVAAGNDPTKGVIVRPPQGNLISGNGANGVLIANGATRTLLSGNFVGTDATGNAPLGNRLDGVAIVRADGNLLIGCTVQDSPFVFYNVLSGNGQNGLRVSDANDTTVHANFMGVGANNAVVVPNGADGLLVSGTSRNTQVGGIIPLGNVISGNARHGIEVRDRASGFVSFNTFAGVFAFGGAAPNRQDGILITSDGGNNLIRTCIVSGNLGNGIELGGNATGVQVTQTAVGTNTAINAAIPNGGSGILLSGNAHGNAIGGFQPSIEPQVTVSGNRRYGIEVVGWAHDNVVYHTYVGTNAFGTAPLGNALSGVFLGPGTWSNTIGGAAPALRNRIVHNGGNGVTILSSHGNRVLGNLIGSNAATGVLVADGRANLIGSAFAGNDITQNRWGGVFLTGLVVGTHVQDNRILGNVGNGLTLSNARGVLVGGARPGTGNLMLGNTGYGIYAMGGCYGSVLWNNVAVANALGNVNLFRSRGIWVIPSGARPFHAFG